MLKLILACVHRSFIDQDCHKQSYCTAYTIMACQHVIVRCHPADAQDDFNNFTASAASYFKTHKTVAPLGRDPTFETSSNLWNYQLIGREGAYYNTSQVSSWICCVACLAIASQLAFCMPPSVQSAAMMHAACRSHPDMHLMCKC